MTVPAGRRSRLVRDIGRLRQVLHGAKIVDRPHRHRGGPVREPLAAVAAAEICLGGHCWASPAFTSPNNTASASTLRRFGRRLKTRRHLRTPRNLLPIGHAQLDTTQPDPRQEVDGLYRGHVQTHLRGPALESRLMHDKISGHFRSETNAKAFMTVRSYIQTGAKHDRHALDLLARLWPTGAWLPSVTNPATG